MAIVASCGSRGFGIMRWSGKPVDGDVGWKWRKWNCCLQGQYRLEMTLICSRVHVFDHLLSVCMRVCRSAMYQHGVPSGHDSMARYAISAWLPDYITSLLWRNLTIEEVVVYDDSGSVAPNTRWPLPIDLHKLQHFGSHFRPC